MNRQDQLRIVQENMRSHTEVCGRMSALSDAIVDAAQIIIASLRNGGRVFFCGNGGSAADAQHLAAEFSGRYLIDRAPLDAIALHCNTSALTAIANDYDYYDIFSRQIRAHGRAGDALVAISTGGESKNIVKAVQKAREIGIHTIVFTGAAPSTLGQIAETALQVPTKEKPRVQEMHILIGHTICELVEKALFPQASSEMYE